jgi:hypothetical protein
MNIGGFLQTALANSKGELIVPAIVTGTLSQPRFAPDAARVAELKLKNVLPSVGNPAGVLGGIANPKNAGKSILDALTGRPAAAPKTEPAKPEDAKPADRGILGIIDSLRKKK